MPEWIDVQWHFFKHDAARQRERLVLSIVWRLPRWLAYWCAIRVLANATTGPYSNQVVPDLLAMDALKRWEAPNA